MKIADQIAQRYNPQTETEYLNALKEAFQEVALLGLYRGGFFDKAAFYGGTALRILYSLDRFSEDLDFSLLQKDSGFDIEGYFPAIIDEFEALDIPISLDKKVKSKDSGIESAFLKNDTATYTLKIQKTIKIKLEIDTTPPLKFQTESKTVLYPTTFNVRTMTLPNLFAGKMHALLFRNWKTRVKGRDWFDFEWYIKNSTPLNLEHLAERMQESGDLQGLLDDQMLTSLLLAKIDELDIDQAKAEVRVFVKDARLLDFWTKDYFRLLASKLKFAKPTKA